MEYALLGNTGLLVSRLAFGAMTFTDGNRDLPTIYNVGAGDADRLVGQAIDASVNFFDTADVYARGQSEEILGRALAARRNEVVIATKVGGRFGKGPLDAGLSRRHIMRSVDASLKRLGPTGSMSTSFTATVPTRRWKRPCARSTTSFGQAKYAILASRTGPPGAWLRQWK